MESLSMMIILGFAILTYVIIPLLYWRCDKKWSRSWKGILALLGLFLGGIFGSAFIVALILKVIGLG